MQFNHLILRTRLLAVILTLSIALVGFLVRRRRRSESEPPS